MPHADQRKPEVSCRTAPEAKHRDRECLLNLPAQEPLAPVTSEDEAQEPEEDFRESFSAHSEPRKTPVAVIQDESLPASSKTLPLYQSLETARATYCLRRYGNPLPPCLPALVRMWNEGKRGLECETRELLSIFIGPGGNIDEALF